MTKNSFSTRLREARLMMGFSMDKLADLTHGAITKQSIYCYEKGIMRPKSDALKAISNALNISEEYFEGTYLKIDMPMLRTQSNGKLSNDELEALEAKISFWAEQYITKEKEAEFQNRFTNPIKGTIVSTTEDAMLAANLLREKWHCGDGPIASILRLFERKGIKILAANLPENVFGLSTWADKKHPLMILDLRADKSSVEKLRFTAVHELAHLLLKLPDDSPLTVEKRCDMFASFFLLPKQALIEELGSKKRELITLDEMIDIKEQYGISLAASIIATRDYGVITTEYKRAWYTEHIEPNPQEIDNGHYAYPETVGREKRIEAVIENAANNNNRNKIYVFN